MKAADPLHSKDMKVFIMYSGIAVLVVLVLQEIYQVQEIIKVS